MSLSIFPMTLKEANTVVENLHRHHKPVRGHRFSLGCKDGEEVIGAVIVGRPVARNTDFRKVAEVTRLVTDGTKNACSFLYSAAARTCREMGFEKIQTFILVSEPGTSLLAAGWVVDGKSAGGKWKHTDGKDRRTDQPICAKQRWVKEFL